MIDLKDFVLKPNGKAGLIRVYKASCDSCKLDRGYIRKRYADYLCTSCAKLNTFPSNVHQFDFKQSNHKRLYRMNCCKCNLDKGYHPQREASRQCYSCSMKERWASGGMKSAIACHRYSYTKQGTLINFKSSWELAYAEFLDKNNTTWTYEPIFPLSNGTSYLPDFELGDGTIIEIKGYFRPDAIVKWNLFCTDYPLLQKKLLTKSELKLLAIL